MVDPSRPGRLVAGRYALTDQIGRGGMGVVWRATDQVLGREVAVKEVTLGLDLSDEERAILRERTLREARAAARLTHPCVTSVYDVVEDDGRPWVVMQHVPSRSLQQILQEDGPLPPVSVARLGLDVLDAVDAAHAAGIVHRDVKPANVLVDDEGHGHLTDFGIATTTGDPTLTTRGTVIGSPSYMSPERANGEEPRPADDLWSIGATLYTAVEGHLPFDRGEPMATLLAVVSEDPEPMLAAGPLEPALRGLLTKDPAQRSTSGQARRHLEAVVARGNDVVSAAGSEAGTAAGSRAGNRTGDPSAPPRTSRRRRVATAVHRGGDLARFDREELRSLASASRALLGSVAGSVAESVVREAREAASRPHSVEDRRHPPAQEPDRADLQPHAAPPRRRRRFKRRWVVVPVVVALLVTLLVLGAVAYLLFRGFSG
jgi:serine/threonine protein kinase